MKHVIPILVLLALAFAPACQTTASQSEQEKRDAVNLQSPELARHNLYGFVNETAQRIRSASEEIFEKAETQEHRRRALVWKMRAISQARRALRTKDLFSAALDLWIMTVQVRDYFEEGEGKDLFGPLQPIAVKAARECEREFEQLARGAIMKERFATARKQIVAYADQHPITNYFVREALTAGSLAGKEHESGALARMVGVSMDAVRSPFRPFAGVGSDVTRASHEISYVASNIGYVVGHLPEQIRWQMELLMLDIQEYHAVVSGVESAERISKSTESFAATAEKLSAQTKTLPAEIRREADALIKEIDDKQANIQVTLDKATATAAQLDGTIKSADTLSKSLDETLQALVVTGKVWDKTIETFYKLMDSLGAFPDKEENGATAKATPAPAVVPAEEVGGAPPFNINDFGRAAQNLTKTAIELRGLVEQAEKLVNDPAVGKRLDDVDRTARATVDHITWRVILVLVAAAVIVLAYRFVRVKFLTG